MKKITGFLFITLFFLVACSTKEENTLQNGDVLFVSANDGSLSSAIDRVTQTEQATNYSHVALLEKDGENYWVLHAGTTNGSERVTLEHFLQETKQENSQVDVYRLKEAFQSSIPNAISVAKNWLGLPYNYSYVLSDESLYCSDFLQRSFAADEVFDLEPMTFVNPETGKIDEAWIEFYEKQGIPVPEGELGCNPNGMANSNKLELVLKNLEY